MLTLPPHDLLTRKLGRRQPLSEADQHAIRALPITVRALPAQRTIVHEEDPSTSCCLVIDGWVCSSQMLDEGRRAILALYVPGDMPDLQSLHLPDTDYGLATLTAATIALVPHEAIRRLIAASPAIATALWQEASVMSAIHRAWIAGLGRREARGRIAHLFCELYLRMRAAGLADGHALAMPLRQTELADTLGLTSVHVNRTLGDLRDQGLIRLDGRRLEIRDWRQLTEVANFDPKYLHLPSGEIEPGATGGSDSGRSRPTGQRSRL